MLDYFAFFVGPGEFLAVILVAIVAAAILGWLLVSTSISATWTQLVDRPTSDRPHPYRDPLRGVVLQPVPILVHIVTILTYASYPCFAACFLIFADEVYHLHCGGSVMALSMFSIGLTSVYSAKRLITRGPDAFIELRSRVTSIAMLSLLTHGVVVIAFLAVAMGGFDDLRFDVHGIKGLTSVVNLGRLRNKASSGPVWLSLNGHMVGAWQEMAIAAVVQAYVSLAHAVAVCALAFQLNAQLVEGSARIRNGLQVKLVVTLGALAGAGFFAMYEMPTLLETASPSEVEIRESERTARAAYGAFQQNCRLPPLPEDVSDLGGRYGSSLFAPGDMAQAQFRTNHPLTYEEQLVAAGWKEHLRLDRGPPPDHTTVHYSFTHKSNHEILLSCNITVDRIEGIVDFNAAAD